MQSTNRHVRANYAALAFFLLVLANASTAFSATPTSPATNLLLDGGFEASVEGENITNSDWPSTSTNFGTPLCDLAFCGISSGTSPRSGMFYVWMGGTPEAEIATAAQTIVIPAGSNPVLKYWLRINSVSSPFTSKLEVKVDGVIIQTINEASEAEPAYMQRSIELPSNFADGGSHTISFEYENPAGGGSSNFLIDDVVLERDSIPVPTPSPTPLNVLVDGGFEASIVSDSVVNPHWPSTSTNFSTPLCSVTFCGGSAGTSPRTGTYFIWFGGTPDTELATAAQMLVIPVGSNPSLTFWMRVNTATSPFNARLEVRLDGVVIQTYNEPSTSEDVYSKRSITLPASVADGLEHMLSFEYENPAGGGTSNFTIDDITLEIDPGSATLTGRVFTPSGQNLRNAVVAITNSLGVKRFATTSSFGIYTFEGVAVGRTYIVGVASKRYRFSPKSVLLNDNLTGVDFVGLE